MSESAAQARTVTAFAERLHVPLRWWVQGTMFVATLWLAMIVSLPAALAWGLTALGLFVLTLMMTSMGSVRVIVRDGELRVGRAHIESRFLGSAVALDPEATRRTAGRDADARAFLMLRPYLKRAVKVAINDPADPAPYWLLSSRRPDQLAAAISAISTADPA